MPSVDEDPPHPLIYPLTRHQRDGSVLMRGKKIDSQIVEALALEPDDLYKRALIPTKDSPGYLQEEALVYLIREYHRVDSDGIVENLTMILVERCKKYVFKRLGSLPYSEREDAYRDVICQLIGCILDLESNIGDY